jgi:adenine deaminase
MRSGSTPRRKHLGIAALVAVLAAAHSSRCGKSSDSADIVFLGGAVYTVDESAPWASAVAVKGDTIAYVGSDEAARSLIGESTMVIDLEGKMLMPGFVDGHTPHCRLLSDLRSRPAAELRAGDP